MVLQLKAVKVATGNLLEADAEALVNTVNTEGVMEKGIALQFKKKFPEMYEAYRVACKEGKVRPGKMHVFERKDMLNPKFIINFPTKRHWRSPAPMEDLEAVCTLSQLRLNAGEFAVSLFRRLAAEMEDWIGKSSARRSNRL